MRVTIRVLIYAINLSYKKYKSNYQNTNIPHISIFSTLYEISLLKTNRHIIQIIYERSKT